MKAITSMCLTVAAILLVSLATHFAMAATHSGRNATGIYFTDGGDGIVGSGTPGVIRRVNIDGSGVTDIIATAPVVNGDSDNSDPRGIVLDTVAGVLYWTDMQGGVFRVGVDGSNPGQVTGVVDDEFATQGIDFDNTTNRIFYHTSVDSEDGAGNSGSNGSAEVVRSVDTNGDNEDIVASDSDDPFPSGLVIDPVNGHVYWAVNNAIRRADLNGDNQTTIIGDQDEPPRGLALDVGGEKIYYTQGGTGVKTIRRVDFDGDNDEELHSLGGGFGNFGWGIALDFATGHIYWANSNADKIQRSNLNGSGVVDLVTGLDSPYGIALDFRERSAVPALSYWSITAISILLLLTGLLAWKRRAA